MISVQWNVYLRNGKPERGICDIFYYQGKTKLSKKFFFNANLNAQLNSLLQAFFPDIF
jgi:hypothetical protein